MLICSKIFQDLLWGKERYWKEKIDIYTMIASATSLVFDYFRKGLNKNEVLDWVVHFWEARNINKGGLLMGLKLFLIDQKV